MREIKFRAWNGKELEYDPVIWGSQEMGECWLNSSIKEQQKIDIVFEQFTGLHDKNGKEIYEGDILKWSDGYPQNTHYDSVVYDEGCFKSWYRSIKSFESSGATIYYFEVVGNIHQNGDLLK